MLQMSAHVSKFPHSNTCLLSFFGPGTRRSCALFRQVCDVFHDGPFSRIGLVKSPVHMGLEQIGLVEDMHRTHSRDETQIQAVA
jgi:hypothetical protein